MNEIFSYPGVLAGRIGEDDRVVAVGVADVVVDSFLLHQPADEVEVGLPVLHAVGPLAVGGGELQLEVGHRMIGEHLLDDVRDGHLLEDAAVGGAGQEPQPRPHHRRVARVAPVLRALREARHVTVEVAAAVVGQRQLHRDVLAEDVVDVDVLLRTQQIELIFGQPSHLLARVHAVKEQHILAERGRDLHDAWQC
jgi:hypothetical protein